MVFSAAIAVVKGSSPHTRGARRRRPHPDEHRGIIPAYAGSTPFQEVSLLVSQDHPRIRGEHFGKLLSKVWNVGSSPHTRGAREPLSMKRRSARIIPAYAGSTSSPASPTPSEQDHPRIRGEHVQINRAIADGSGSSPHTRGAPASGRPASSAQGIIPAYAGSTHGAL